MRSIPKNDKVAIGQLKVKLMGGLSARVPESRCDIAWLRRRLCVLRQREHSSPPSRSEPSLELSTSPSDPGASSVPRLDSPSLFLGCWSKGFFSCTLVMGFVASSTWFLRSEWTGLCRSPSLLKIVFFSVFVLLSRLGVGFAPTTGSARVPLSMLFRTP